MAASPQVYNVWIARHTGGLSEITYGAGLVMALAWTLYGVLHRQKPIWLINTVWIGMNLAMVLGLARYS
jgi:uncharacterized protein with PQ loop repeat